MDKDGNVLTSEESVLRRLGEFFEELMNGDRVAEFFFDEAVQHDLGQ